MASEIDESDGKDFVIDGDWLTFEEIKAEHRENKVLRELVQTFVSEATWPDGPLVPLLKKWRELEAKDGE